MACQYSPHFSNLDTEIDLSVLQFATAAGDQLFWGYGKDACPGRFFASNLMKIMTIDFLENYDFAFRDGVRPPDVIRDFRTIPNPVFPILMKSRKA